MIVETPIIWIHLCMLWFVLLLTGALVLAFWQGMMQGRVGMIFVNMGVVVCSQILYLPLRAVTQYRDKGRVFENWLDATYRLPFLLFVILALALTIVEAFVVRSSFCYRSHHITKTSLYESFQKLPTGICCYLDGGMTKLVNARMDQIAKQLTGSGITNGELFLKALQNEALGSRKTDFEEEDGLPTASPKQSAERILTLRLDGGEVFSFTLTDIPYKNTVLHEILATDVTQEYRNLEILQKEKEHMQNINRRLKEYSKKVVQRNIEKEILDAKVRIHDELGHVLIVSKRYLREGDGDQETILNLWRKNITLLKDEREEQESEDYETIFYIARCAGVEIEVSGDLPDKQEAKHILLTAISECLTNVSRHTHGDKISIEAAQNNGFWQICFTNNGDAPKETIKEGGGLTNLRKMVESAGGEMGIQSLPYFALNIRIPQK